MQATAAPTIADKVRTILQAGPAKVRRYLWAGTTLLTRGRPRRALTFPGGGLGDELLCATVARELRRRGESGICIISRHPELFRNNPDVQVPLFEDDRSLGFLTRLNVPLERLNYAPHLAVERRDLFPAHHLLVEMCRQAGIRGEIMLRPYITLTPTELASGQLCERQVAIHSSGLSARSPMVAKEWFPERFQQIVHALRDRFHFVQVGAEADPPLDGAMDFRGKTSLRQTAAILANSMLFIGLVGFVMHLARAVDCPAVIVYGGRELPSVTGYLCNVNLTRPLACSPCGLYGECEFHRACMDQITVGDVLVAIERQARREERALPVEVVTIS